LESWKDYKTPEDRDAENAATENKSVPSGNPSEFRPLPHQRSESDSSQDYAQESYGSVEYPSIDYTPHETFIPAHQRDSTGELPEYEYPQPEYPLPQDNVSSSERASHVNNAPDYHQATPFYGTVEQQGEQVYKAPDRHLFEQSIKDTTIKLGGVAKQDGEYVFQNTEETVAASRGVAARFADNAPTPSHTKAPIPLMVRGKATPPLPLGASKSSAGSAASGATHLPPKTSGNKLRVFSVGSSIAGATIGALNRLMKDDRELVDKAESAIKGSVIKGVKDTPKNTVKTVKGTVKVAKGATKPISAASKLAVRTARLTWMVVARTVAGIQKAVKAVSATFSNPYTAIAAVVVAVVVVAVVVIVVVFGIVIAVIPNISLRSENDAIMSSDAYVAGLDAEKQYLIQSQESIEREYEITEYRYFLNGEESTQQKMIVYTRRDILLAYLDCLYEDYALGGALGEIDELHAILHQVEIIEWIYTYEVYHFGDPDGPDEALHEDWVEEITVYCMDIYLYTRCLGDYISENYETLFNEEQRERYELLFDVGVYTLKKDLVNPFSGREWEDKVITPYGAYIDSYLDEDGETIIFELKYHKGVDIAMPAGTGVRACTSGIAEVGFTPELGHYVKVYQEGNTYTLYGNLRNVAVTDGAKVDVGDLVGYVGESGNSGKEPHLHLEYCEQGVDLCPLIFSEGGSGSAY